MSFHTLIRPIPWQPIWLRLMFVKPIQVGHLRYPFLRVVRSCYHPQRAGWTENTILQQKQNIFSSGTNAVF